ncbi:MAG TPA: TolC family protein [Acidobacteriaceae bacterium]|nr:TolC family protein [Acidobacteriaceae bacterium]
MRTLSLLGFTLIAALTVQAQTSTPVTTNNGTPPAPPNAPLPAAPTVPVVPLAPGISAPSTQTPATAPAQIRQLPNSLTAPVIPANAPTLTITQAEQTALAHNPRVSIARLLALAEGQVTRERRAAELPTIGGVVTAVGADNGSRITAGALNNPALYQRAAAGVTLNQLITDFGRTRNLVTSAHLNAEAAQSTLTATRDDIVFATDDAFYRALGAQALIQVATQTVNARQATANQVGALARARLRSTLDVSFANAALAQAQLLLLDARNESASAQADLAALLGDDSGTIDRLVDQTPAAPAPAPLDAAPLVKQAFAQRPDLASLQQQADAAHHFATAERDLSMPTVTALGATGDAPWRASEIPNGPYGAVGLNVSIPLFNGFLFSAREQEAKLRAGAADAQVQQLRDTITRDVTTTVLQAQDNFNRIAVAQQLVDQANSALSLAQTRYRLGLSSIVELSQAQLLQTQAEIELTNARYAYQGSLSAIRYQTGQ